MRIARAVDSDANGVIDFEEFVAAFSGAVSVRPTPATHARLY